MEQSYCLRTLIRSNKCQMDSRECRWLAVDTAADTVVAVAEVVVALGHSDNGSSYP